MAVVRSNAIGKARKSIGGVTYRLRKGRTLASRKRGPSDASKAMVRDEHGFLHFPAMAFYFCQYWISKYHDSIKRSFDKSRHGSEFNNFARYNMRVFKKMIDDSNIEGIQIGVGILYDVVEQWCIRHPKQFVRIKKRGLKTVYCSGQWWDHDDPDGTNPKKVHD